MATPTGRYLYTPDQLSQFFTRINLPQPARETALRASTEPTLTTASTTGLPLLSTLLIHTIAHIPYDNLSVFLTPTPTIPLHPTTLFTKMVTHKRGGICYETGVLFSTVLRSIGFDVKDVASRTHKSMSDDKYDSGLASEWNGLGHMLSIVHFDVGGSRYFVDVSMGVQAPGRPVKLVRGDQVLEGGWLRVRWDRVEDGVGGVSSRDRMWILEETDLDVLALYVVVGHSSLAKRIMCCQPKVKMGDRFAGGFQARGMNSISHMRVTRSNSRNDLYPERDEIGDAEQLQKALVDDMGIEISLDEANKIMTRVVELNA